MLNKFVASLCLVAGLLACGGGGGGSSSQTTPPADAGGIWYGTLTGTGSGPTSVVAASNPDGTVYAYNPGTNEVYLLQMNGTGSTWTGTGTDFQPAGTMLTFTCGSGTLSPQDAITCSWSSSQGDSGAAALAFDPLYDRPVTLAALAGSYTADASTDGTAVSFTLQGDGSFTGSSGSKAISGSLTPVDSTHNLYNVSISVGGNQASGFAFWADAQETNFQGRALYVAGSNATQGWAGIFVGQNSTATPSAPTGLQVASTTNSTISLSWNAVAGATAYTVYRGTTQVYNGNATAFTDTGLSAGTSYSYTVSATTAGGTSPASSPVTGATLAAGAVPATPTGLAVTAETSTTLTLSWTASAGATGYTLDRGGATVYTGTGLSYTDTGLASGQTYSYTVNASDSYGASAFSGAVTGTTTVQGAAPSAPSPQVVGVTSTSVTIGWAAVPGATSYLLYCGTSLVYSGSATQYTTTGLTPNTQYPFTMFATNSYGTSPSSNPVEATTSASGSVPAIPAGLTVNGVTETTISLSWDASTGATGYLLYRGGNQIYSGTATSYTDTGLTSGTTYVYTVAAGNTYGNSSVSAAVDGTTSTPSTAQLCIWSNDVTDGTILVDLDGVQAGTLVNGWVYPNTPSWNASGTLLVTTTPGTHTLSANTGDGPSWSNQVTLTSGQQLLYQLIVTQFCVWTNANDGGISLYLNGGLEGYLSEYFSSGTPSWGQTGTCVITVKPGSYSFTAQSTDGPYWGPATWTIGAGQQVMKELNN